MKGATLAALLALATSTTAEAARRPCLPPAEAEALVTVLLPDFLTAVAKRCATALPANATLRGGLDPLVARWRGEATGLEASAAAAVTKMGGGEAGAIEPAALLTVLRSGLIDELVKDVKAADCPKIDRAITLAAPLPARNLAGLFIMAAQLGGGRTRDLDICRAPTP